MGISYGAAAGLDGTMAKREFYIHQHPGGNSPADMPPEMRAQMKGGVAQQVASQAAGGDWIILVDGSATIIGPSQFPVPIEGTNVSGVEVGVLNESYNAGESFSVRRENGTYVTTVDGRIVFEDDVHHPFYIGWSRTARQGSDTGFVFGDSFGSDDLGF